MESLILFRDGLWQWAGLPLLALAALVLTLFLRLPQLVRLPDAFRALTAHDPGAEGTLPPATAVALSTAASIGAGAAVAAATAYGLGGAGSLAWLWLFGFLVAPLRMAEALLTRTSPPGKAGKDRETGSLAARFEADDLPFVVMLGRALFVLAPIAAVVVVGGLHGTAVVDAAEQLLPGSAEPIGFAVAAAAALFAFFGRGKAWLGWTALAALGVLFLVCIAALLFDTQLALGALTSAMTDAFDGTPELRSFSGALAGEIAAAAFATLLPVANATGGLDGSMAALAQPRSVKQQASAALLPVLAHVVLATLVGLGIAATSAHARAIESSRHLDEVRFYDSAFETASQRREPEREWSGFIRVIDGRAQATPLEIGTDRGMVDEPHFVEADGSEGNFAIRIEDGRVTRILRPDQDGALMDAPPAGIAQVVVTGRMLPARGALLAAAFTRGGGDAAGRAALAALMILAALGAAGVGLGIARMFAGRVTENGARAMSALPAIGLVLGATSAGPMLAAAGSIVAALATILVSVGLLAKVTELAKQIAPAPAAAAAESPAPAPAPKTRRRAAR
jgi:AGCS family alanine or glycine:cation symporter